MSYQMQWETGFIRLGLMMQYESDCHFIKTMESTSSFYYMILYATINVNEKTIFLYIVTVL